MIYIDVTNTELGEKLWRCLLWNFVLSVLLLKFNAYIYKTEFPYMHLYCFQTLSVTFLATPTVLPTQMRRNIKFRKKKTSKEEGKI